MTKLSHTGYVEKPRNSRVRLRESPRELVINIPPQGFHPRLILIILICIAPIALGFVLAIGWILNNDGFANLTPIFFSMTLGLVMTSGLVFSLASRATLYMDDQWFFVKHFLPFKGQELSIGRFGGKISDIGAVEIDSTGFKFRHESDRGILLKEGENAYSIGSYLSRPEKLWLVEKIRKFLIALDSQGNTFLAQQSLSGRRQGSLKKVAKEEIYLSSQYSQERQNTPLRKPNWSEVTLTKEPNEFLLTIPSAPQSQLFFLAVLFAWIALAFAASAGSIVIPLLFQFAEDSYRFALLLGVILMSPVVFFASLLAYQWMLAHTKIVIQIDSAKFLIRKKYLGRVIRVEGCSEKLSGVELREVSNDADDENNFEPGKRPLLLELLLLEQDKTHSFGEYLDKCEQLWLLQEMNVFLKELSK